MNNIKHKTRKPNLNKKIHKLGPNELVYDWIECATLTDNSGRILGLTEDRCNLSDGSMDFERDSVRRFKRLFRLKPSFNKIMDSILESNVWTDGTYTIAFERWTTCESKPCP